LCTSFRRTEPKKASYRHGGWVNDDAIRWQRFDFGSFAQPKDRDKDFDKASKKKR